MVSTIFTEYEIKQVSKRSYSYKVRSSIFCQGNVQRKGNSAGKLYSTYTVTAQGMEGIVGVVVEKIDVSA